MIEIKIKTGPNPVMQIYYIGKQIVPHSLYDRLHVFDFPPEQYQQHLEEVGDVGAQLHKAVLALPGVKDAFAHHFALSIERTRSSKWNDIEPGVIEALKNVFKGETLRIIRESFWKRLVNKVV